MTKRILIITEAGNAWPSGYVRALIYKDSFINDGIEVKYISRQWPALVRFMENPGYFLKMVLGPGVKKILYKINSFIADLKEKRIIGHVRKGYDVIVLQKLFSIKLIAAIRRNSRARLVYDLNDGVWLPFFDLFSHTEEILHIVDAVTCDNPRGLEYARQFNSSLFLVPDPPQVEQFDEYRSSIDKAGKQVVIGWIGSPSAAFNLYSIWEPLEALFGRYSNNEITLRLVGVGNNRELLPKFEKVHYTTLPYYSQVEMIREVLQMDIGLFPLFNIDNSVARGILKATIYMSGGVCVIASPVGQNKELIIDGVNGFLADSHDEWFNKMIQLIENEAYRKTLAQKGLDTVRKEFTITRCYQKLKKALFPGEEGK